MEKDFDKKKNRNNEKKPGKSSTVSYIEKIAELTEKLKQKTEEIESLKKEMAETKDAALRIRADAENYRKRIEKDNTDFVRRANENILKDLLPVVDSITIAINSASDESVKKGISIMKDSVISVLKKYGVEEIDVQGKEFDPNTCEAFLFEENPEVEVDMVAEVLQPGFKLYDKVLRSAKVKVSKSGK